MSNMIKCPICHEIAGLSYNENRVYQSRCQNMECRETVTVTAPSGRVAEELFSRFEQASIQPNTTIVNHEIVFNPTGNEFDKARDQLLGTYKLVKIEDWEYKFIKQPKLSIPKKIAEMLDVGYAYEGDEERDHSWLIHNMDDFTSSESYCEFYSWLEDSKDNYSLAITYLAGKALGVELVEVTDE